MVRIRELGKSFGKNEVLKGLDLDIYPGKIYAVLGPNGSGKTTMVKSILGLVKPDSGSIRFRGTDIGKDWKYRSKIGYMPQIARFPEHLSAGEFLHMLKDIRGVYPHEEELLKTFKLEKDIGKKLGHLSGGTKQKVNVVQACMFVTDLLICDEPTVGLDAVSLVAMKKILREYVDKNRTIIFITHITPLVEELADEMIFLQEGNIYYQGSVAGLKNKYGGTTLEKAIANMMEAQV